MTRQEVPAPAITVRGRSGNAEGPSGSHYIIGPLQKASGPRKKRKPRCLIFGTRTILYCRPSVTAANDDSVSLAKSRSYRTALRRTNCPLRVQPELFRPIRFQTTFSTFSATFGNYSSLFSDRVPSPPVFVSYTHPGHPVLICSSVREIL